MYYRNYFLYYGSSFRLRFLRQGQLKVKGSSIPGTYFRLDKVKVTRIEEVFDSRNLVQSTALDPIFSLK